MNKIDNTPATATQKAVTPQDPLPHCKVEEIEINCPHCNQILEVPPELLGQAADCPSCNCSIQLPSKQPNTPPPLPATDPAIEKTNSAKPVKEEKCSVCGIDLKFLTRCWGSSGVLKDEGEICNRCLMKIQSIVGVFKYKSVNFTKAEVIDHIREFDDKREENTLQKQEQKIAKQKEREAAALVKQEQRITEQKEREAAALVKQEQRITEQKERETAALVKQELKEKLQDQKNIETRKVQEKIQNTNSYEVDYLGGIPGVNPDLINICATPYGIYAFSKGVFSKDMKELFIIEWKYISRISHSSTTKGSDATKNALLTAGMMKNSSVAVLGGLLCDGQKTEGHITITCKDDTGYESEILFRGILQSDSAEIALFLNAQRAILYKPEKTPTRHGTVENPTPVIDSIEQLKKIAELKNTGIITEEEFGIKKAELLTRI